MAWPPWVATAWIPLDTHGKAAPAGHISRADRRRSRLRGWAGWRLLMIGLVMLASNWASARRTTG